MSAMPCSGSHESMGPNPAFHPCLTLRSAASSSKRARSYCMNVSEKKGWLWLFGGGGVCVCVCVCVCVSVCVCMELHRSASSLKNNTLAQAHTPNTIHPSLYPHPHPNTIHPHPLTHTLTRTHTQPPFPLTHTHTTHTHTHTGKGANVHAGG